MRGRALPHLDRWRNCLPGSSVKNETLCDEKPMADPPSLPPPPLLPPPLPLPPLMPGTQLVAGEYLILLLLANVACTVMTWSLTPYTTALL